MAELTFSQELLGDVSICYSGGLDSTSVAYMCAAKRKGGVHLHTFRHGYGYLFYFWAGASARRVAGKFPPGVITHRYVNTKDLFDAIAIRSLSEDRRRYGQWFGCCMGCTMAVVTKVLIYNLERRIPHMMFCSSVGGQYAVMSTPQTIEMQKDFCGRYGVIYSTPLIDDNIVKAQERELLNSTGVFPGIRFLDKHSFGNQGYCLLSLQHLPDVLFNVHPVYNPENVKRFFNDKLPICEEYIRGHFKNSGRDLDACVAEMKRVTGGRS